MQQRGTLLRISHREGVDVTRIVQLLLVLILGATVVVAAPGADAKPPPITFNSCTTPLAANQSGRTYLLTSGTAPCPGDGVQVSEDNITIDLGGFDLTGSGGATRGVVISPNVVGTRIKHGTITKFSRGIESPN